jgi:hypothetical protein
MKTTYLWLVLALQFWTTSGSPQSQQPPKEEYLFVASATNLTITKGQQDSIKLTVLRSKSSKTGKSSVAVNPPKEAALDVKVKQLPGKVDEYMVYLITTNDTKTGEYNFVPTCTLRNKDKGIVLKLIIN